MAMNDDSRIAGHIGSSAPTSHPYKSVGRITDGPIAISLWLGLQCLPVVAAEPPSSTYQLDIPAENLDDALQALAIASQHKLIYSSELVEGKKAPALKGQYTTEDAVRELLRDVSVSYEVRDGLVILRAKHQKLPADTTSDAHRVNTSLRLAQADAAAAPSDRQAPSTAADVPASSTAAPPAADMLQEIAVTGSRLITNSSKSPTPVTVLSTDELLAANPGNITTAMMMLPSLLGSPNQGGQSGTNYQAVLNLRGLGGLRNLVLFDGHRVEPTTILAGIQTGVDSNLIPTMLLKRVDVVTGGASAVYGSDAVSGVINYIVDRDFNGVKVNAQQSISDYGDDRANNIGIAGGKSLFDGRVHIEGSYQRIYDPGLPDRMSRDWGRGVWSMQGSVPGSTAGAGTAANPYALYSNSRFSVTNFGGLINSGPLSNLQFAQNGVLSPFVHGQRTGSSTVEVGGDGGYYTTADAFGEQHQDLLFGRIDFDVTDKTKAYFEVSASTVLNYNHLANAELRTRAIGYNNPYLSSVQQPYQATIDSQVAANPLSSFNYSRIFTPDQIPEPVNSARGTQYLYIAGLEGSISRYQWNVGFEHSESSMRDSDQYNISNARLYASLNAVTVTAANVGTSGLPIGSIACNARLVNPAAYGNCVPLNVFGPTASNSAAYAYMQQYTAYNATAGMDDATASISGSPFSNWAGPVQIALSAEWRRQTYEVDTDATSNDPVNCTGIQFNCNASTAPYFAAVTNPFPRQSVKVSEAAIETGVPLLVDKLFAKSLDFNGAARFTDYSSSGSVYTWKVGLTWAINDSFSVRATRSRDIRAPNIQQLYSPSSCATMSFTDIHTNNTTGTLLNCTTGNPNLTPEKSDTSTLGFVWTPRFIDGLTASIDGYRINITNSLNQITATQPATQAACESSGGTSSICDLYIRPFPYSNRTAANFPTQVNSLVLNSGTVFTQGLDVDVDYTNRIFDRAFAARLLGNWQPQLTWDLGPAGIYFIGGAADGLPGVVQTPNVKGLLQLDYALLNNLNITMQERYRNALKQHGSPLLYFAIGKQPPAAYTDLTLNYKVAPELGNIDLFLNVRNLFNKQPTPWASSGGNSQIGSFGGYMLGDDIIGRYFTMGLRAKF